MVAGVDATHMSENPDIELSIKREMTKLGSETTSNRIFNNGKRIVFSPVEIYNGCGSSSGNARCSGERCCSKNDQCVLVFLLQMQIRQ